MDVMREIEITALTNSGVVDRGTYNVSSIQRIDDTLYVPLSTTN